MTRPELFFDLKPCPFCGAPASLEIDSDHHGVYYNLGCSIKGCLARWVCYTEDSDIRSIETAVNLWNKRALL